MLHVLKKISNSLSTDNSIPIFGYSINEADITSASFFLCRYHTLQGCVLSPLLCPKSHFTDKAAASVPHSLCQSCPTFGMPFKKECHVCKRRGFAPVMINLKNDVGKNPQSAPVLPYTMNETAPERDGLILCFGSQETAMLCNQLFLGSLSSFSLLVPYVCIIHNRSTDEDGSVSTEADTEYQGYGKTTDRLTAEDCDSKHCHESRY